MTIASKVSKRKFITEVTEKHVNMKNVYLNLNLKQLLDTFSITVDFNCDSILHENILPENENASCQCRSEVLHLVLMLDLSQSSLRVNILNILNVDVPT